MHLRSKFTAPLLAALAVTTSSVVQAAGYLPALNDEFNDDQSRDSWTEIAPDAANLVEVADGQLTIRPNRGSWYRGNQSVFLYREIEGDFVIETQLDVHSIYNPTQPSTGLWTGGGLMVRNPDATSENWINYMVGRIGTQGMLGQQTTTNVDAQTNMEMTPGERQGRIRICRVGDEFHMLRRMAGDESWQFASQSTNTSPSNAASPIDRPDFGQQVQVGVMASAYGAADVEIDFEYLRAAVPDSVADCAADEIIVSLEDDFDGAASLADYDDLHPELHRDIQVADGQLRLTPNTSAWYRNAHGPLLSKEVTGDFMAEMDLSVRSVWDENSSPNGAWTGGGVLLRDPASGAGSENWVAYWLGNLGFTGVDGTERKSTVNSNFTMRERSVNNGGPLSGSLRVCRIGDEVSLYRRLEGEANWSEEPENTNLDDPRDPNSPVMRPDLPNTLQVGIMGSAYGAPDVQINVDSFDIKAVDPVACGLTAPESTDANNNAPQRVPQTLTASCGDSCTRNWSDAETWGGEAPQFGDTVIIPNDVTVRLDETTADLAGLTVNGALEFVDGDADINLTADWIMLHGRLQIGSESTPYQGNASITLNAQNAEESIMDMGTRGIMVMGGELILHGDAPEVVWTQINGHAEQGAQNLNLTEAADWNSGDQIVIAPTDWFNVARTESASIAAINGGAVQLEAPLQNFHWGLLQYVTEDGVSLNASEQITPALEGTPTVLDQRAEVGNLTRNIVIQGANDSLWNNDGFGAHVMFMGLGSTVEVDGVEFRRMGQRGNLGRYPIHWHRLSYNDAGAELGDANGMYVRNSAIHQSENRCMTIHATNGVEVSNNICHNIRGHALFMEDGSERRNVIQGNLMLNIHEPHVELLAHEFRGFQRGPSGFWLTNPDNTVRNNVAADSVGNGFWLAFSARPFGPSATVDIHPRHIPIREFADNVAHSNQVLGFNLDWVVVDEEGNTRPLSYNATISEQPEGLREENWVRNTFPRMEMYKNTQGAMWNRTTFATYENWVSADNVPGGMGVLVGGFFAGAGPEGLIVGSTLIGTSLNNRSDYPNPDRPPVALASYHSAFDMQDNVVVNFPFVEDTPSGAFNTNDYYTRPVDRGTVRNFGNTLINSHPGYRARSDNSSYTLAGALWDPQGLWGEANNYWTYDEPFFTHGEPCTQVAPAGQNGASCSGEFYGVRSFVLNQTGIRSRPMMNILATRVTESGEEIGTWQVDDGRQTQFFEVMRHFAARAGGAYTLEFPEHEEFTETEDPLMDVGVRVTNMHTDADQFVLAIEFDGEREAGVFSTNFWNYYNEGFEDMPDRESETWNKYSHREVDSLEDVHAATDRVFWQDHESDLVWIRVIGGVDDRPADDPYGDVALYRDFHLRVHD